VSPDSQHLQSIKTFKQLVAYLRDELDWPIEGDDFEELTFDYSAEELGLDPETAAKIKEIKQLRPLSSKQPWGVFFVNFEPKRLPVVALRRILSKLVFKKRQSANKAQQPVWQLHDLLFISSYGEAEHRDITFAHFSETDGTGDLATLRVLGWDDEDTGLHVAHVEKVLREKLTWPDDGTDLESWRVRWSSAFTLRYQEVIRTSKALAERLAALATRIRKRANSVLRIESAKGQLRRLYAAFKEALIHDLSEDDFADMYAQTISYGLLTARISRPAGLVADNLRDMVPVTNPFLKELLETFLSVGGRKGYIDFDELGVNEVVQLLRDADMAAVLRDFGDRNPEEDPAIHFYELFLKEYDPEKRVQRGVFYTPRPIVSFIVRSVHELLQRNLGLQDGLADVTTWGEMSERNKNLSIPEGVSPSEHFVSILDPATGTATFLVEAVAVIYETMRKKWLKQGHMELEVENLWNEYVPKHLLTRLYGYELLMAPYAIAHMKLPLKLKETGFTGWDKLAPGDRARIYLTNALEPASGDSKQQAFEEWAPALAHEARAVNAIKRNKRFTVVIGNPPYAGHSKNNEIKWIVDLVKAYTRDEPSLQGPGQGKWLQDDYVKFLRFGQYVLKPTPFALLAMITNHRYLTNRTFRGMRRLWMADFSTIRILDLHGNNVVHEVSPLGFDENVFDIEQGVAIGVFSKNAVSNSDIGYSEVWGRRTTPNGRGKYDFLWGHSVLSTPWTKLTPKSPDWLLAPRSDTGTGLRAEFEAGLKMHELMNGALGPNGKPQSGLATMHDGFALSFSIDELEQKIRAFSRQLVVTKLRQFLEPYAIQDNGIMRLLSGHFRLQHGAKI